MTNVGIYDGDLLIVDKSLNPKNFSTVIANVNEELVVKTLIKSKETNYLTSGSKNTSDRINLTDNPEIIIWGVVTYVIQTIVKKKLLLLIAILSTFHVRDYLILK